MTLKIGIHGFGRNGRMVFRAAVQRHAVHDRGHAKFTHAVVDVAPAVRRAGGVVKAQ